MDENREASSLGLPKDPYPVSIEIPTIAFPLPLQNQPPSDTDQRQNPESEVPSGNGGAQNQIYTGRSLMIPRAWQPLTHQFNCNHGTVTRQYSIEEYETCDNCGRRPFLNWFYLCNEDSSGFSDPIDPDGSLLSPWIIDAILAGHYTDVQREILIKQKLEVLSVHVRDIYYSPASSLSAIEVEEDIAPHKSLIQKPDSNGHPHVPRVDEDKPSPIVSQLPIYSPCSYRACQYCDRKLHERAWLSLNEVCNDTDAKPPTVWDLRDRPISDVEVVRNLGLRSCSPPSSPPHGGLFGPDTARSYWIERSWRVDNPGYRSTYNLQHLLSTIEEAGETVDIDTGEIQECFIEDLEKELGIPIVMCADESHSCASNQE